MNCRYCNKPLSFLQKVAGSQFCSAAHQRAFSQQLDQLAVERLMQPRPVAPPPGPQAEAKPEKPAKVERKAQPLEASPVRPPEPEVGEAHSPAPPVEQPVNVAENAPSAADDDIKLPSFVLKKDLPPKVDAPAPKQAKASRYSIDDLDDVELPEFLKKRLKKAPEKPKPVMPSTPSTDDIVLPPGVRRNSQAAPRPAETSTPPPFITRQGKGGRSPQPITAPPAPVVTPPPATEAPAAAAAAPAVREPLFDTYVLPHAMEFHHWIPTVAVEAANEPLPLDRTPVRFERPGLRMPPVTLDQIPYTASKPTPALSESIRIEMPALAAKSALRDTDDKLTPLVAVSPDVDMLLEAPGRGQSADVELAEAVPCGWPAARAVESVLHASPARPVAFLAPRVKLPESAPQAPVEPAMALAAPRRLSAAASKPAAIEPRPLSEPRTFPPGPVEIPRQVKVLAELAGRGFQAAPGMRLHPESDSGGAECRQTDIAGLTFAKPGVPFWMQAAAVEAPEVDAAEAIRVAPPATPRISKPPRIRFAAMAFPGRGVVLPSELMRLSAPLLEAAGLLRTGPGESSAPEAALRGTSAQVSVRVAPPELESSSYVAVIDARGVPACFRNADPETRLCEAVAFNGVPAAANPASSALGFGAVDFELAVTFPEASPQPVDPPAAPVAEAKPAPRIDRDAPYRRRIAITLPALDSPSTPMLSPLVCDFYSAPMAKVIHK